nr:PREDICTED: WD repeat-containing protein 87 [Latimeria chalumnae]|eukprot:XP_014349293.1 PREDICTED: WD repeat-containing protein 87 [Latimeria chalumnae]
MSMCYNKETGELITGGTGMITFWSFNSAPSHLISISKTLNHSSCSLHCEQFVNFIAIENRVQAMIALCGNHVKVFNYQKKVESTSFEDRNGAVLKTCYMSWLERHLFTGDADGFVQVWNFDSGSLLHEYKAHSDFVSSLVVCSSLQVVFSASADQSVKEWDMFTWELLRCFSFREDILHIQFINEHSFYCHTPNSLSIQTINTFYELFNATGNLVKKMTRIKCPSDKARILVIDKDGIIQFLSPVTGEQILLILPFSILEKTIDYAYDPEREELFITTGSVDVLVFDTSKNPGTAKYYLKTSSHKNDVLCLGTSRISPFTQKPIYLVFSGHKNGQIKLLSPNPYFMHEKKAHGSAVRMICSVCVTQEAKASDILGSYGTDDYICLWKISSRGNNIEITLFTSIACSCKLQYIKVVPDCVYTITESSTMMIFNVAEPHSSFSKEHGILTTKRLHNGQVTAFDYCYQLKTIVTGGSDWAIRIWNTTGNLLVELTFSKQIGCVCFANSRGDLLATFNNNIYYISCLQYLTDQHLEELADNKRLDDIYEAPLPFSFHVLLSLKEVLVPKYHLDQGGEKQMYKRLKVKDTSNFLLKLLSAKAGKGNKHDVVFEKCVTNEGDLNRIDKLKESQHLNTKYLGLTPNTEQTYFILLNQLSASQDEGQDSSFAAYPPIYVSEYAPFCTRWPIAPDGYIPNSVIRALLRTEKVVCLASAQPLSSVAVQPKQRVLTRIYSYEKRAIKTEDAEAKDKTHVEITKGIPFKLDVVLDQKIQAPVTVRPDDLLIRIANSPWLRTKLSEINLDTVIAALLAQMENATPAVYYQCTKALANINKVYKLLSHHKDLIYAALFEDTLSKNSWMRLEAWKTLRTMGLLQEDNIVHLAQALMDSDKRVRTLAKELLKEMAGITDKAALVKLMNKLGIMQEVPLDFSQGLITEMRDALMVDLKSKLGETMDMTKYWVHTSGTAIVDKGLLTEADMEPLPINVAKRVDYLAPVTKLKKLKKTRTVLKDTGESNLDNLAEIQTKPEETPTLFDTDEEGEREISEVLDLLDSQESWFDIEEEIDETERSDVESLEEADEVQRSRLGAMGEADEIQRSRLGTKADKIRRSRLDGMEAADEIQDSSLDSQEEADEIQESSLDAKKKVDEIQKSDLEAKGQADEIQKSSLDTEEESVEIKKSSIDIKNEVAKIQKLKLYTKEEAERIQKSRLEAQKKADKIQKSRTDTIEADKVQKSRLDTKEEADKVQKSRLDTKDEVDEIQKSRPGTKEEADGILKSRPDTIEDADGIQKSKPDTIEEADRILKSRPDTIEDANGIQKSKPDTIEEADRIQKSRTDTIDADGIQKSKYDTMEEADRIQKSRPDTVEDTDGIQKLRPDILEEADRIQKSRPHTQAEADKTMKYRLRKEELGRIQKLMLNTKEEADQIETSRLKEEADKTEKSRLDSEDEADKIEKSRLDSIEEDEKMKKSRLDSIEADKMEKSGLDSIEEADKMEKSGLDSIEEDEKMKKSRLNSIEETDKMEKSSLDSTEEADKMEKSGLDSIEEANKKETARFASIEEAVQIQKLRVYTKGEDHKIQKSMAGNIQIPMFATKEMASGKSFAIQAVSGKVQKSSLGSMKEPSEKLSGIQSVYDEIQQSRLITTEGRAEKFQAVPEKHHKSTLLSKEGSIRKLPTIRDMSDKIQNSRIFFKEENTGRLLEIIGTIKEIQKSCSAIDKKKAGRFTEISDLSDKTQRFMSDSKEDVVQVIQGVPEEHKSTFGTKEEKAGKLNEINDISDEIQKTKGSIKEETAGMLIKLQGVPEKIQKLALGAKKEKAGKLTEIQDVPDEIQKSSLATTKDDKGRLPEIQHVSDKIQEPRSVKEKMPTKLPRIHGVPEESTFSTTEAETRNLSEIQDLLCEIQKSSLATKEEKQGELPEIQGVSNQIHRSRFVSKDGKTRKSLEVQGVSDQIQKLRFVARDEKGESLYELQSGSASIESLGTQGERDLTNLPETQSMRYLTDLPQTQSMRPSIELSELQGLRYVTELPETHGVKLSASGSLQREETTTKYQLPSLQYRKEYEAQIKGTVLEKFLPSFPIEGSDIFRDAGPGIIRYIPSDIFREAPSDDNAAVAKKYAYSFDVYRKTEENTLAGFIPKKRNAKRLLCKRGMDLSGRDPSVSRQAKDHPVEATSFPSHIDPAVDVERGTSQDAGHFQIDPKKQYSTGQYSWRHDLYNLINAHGLRSQKKRKRQTERAITTGGKPQGFICECKPVQEMVPGERILSRVCFRDSKNVSDTKFHHVLPMPAHHTILTMDPDGKSQFGALRLEWSTGQKISFKEYPELNLF